LPPVPAELVDTNVLGELARPRPNAGVLRWADGVTFVALSVVTVEEIFFGLAWRPNARVREWVDSFLAEHCAILPVTAEVARRSGELRGRLRSSGSSRTQADMLIAATAQVHGLTVVTRNVRDFEDVLVPVLNPFS